MWLERSSMLLTVASVCLLDSSTTSLLILSANRGLSLRADDFLLVEREEMEERELRKRNQSIIQRTYEKYTLSGKIAGCVADETLGSLSMEPLSSGIPEVWFCQVERRTQPLPSLVAWLVATPGGHKLPWLPALSLYLFLPLSIWVERWRPRRVTYLKAKEKFISL